MGLGMEGERRARNSPSYYGNKYRVQGGERRNETTTPGEEAFTPVPAQIRHNQAVVRRQGGQHVLIHRAADHQAVDEQEW